MENQVITIDTNILIRAFEHQDPYHLDVATYASRPQSMIGLDVNNIIISEYQKNLGGSQGFQKWYQRLCQRMAIHFCDGGIPNCHRTQLTTHGCHEPTDQVFIGVAYNSGKVLVSEDSDVGKGPRGCAPPHCYAGAYLRDVMGIQVLSAEEASNSWSS
jgi:hypothetical protein